MFYIQMRPYCSKYFLKSNVRTKLMKNMEKLFQKIDVLATPCTGNGTWKICEEDGECKCPLEKSLLIDITKTRYEYFYRGNPFLRL